MTFSIVARCPSTGMLGVAVSSSSPAVGARCARAIGGIGASLTQNFTDPMLGVKSLELMQAGASARQAIDIVCQTSAELAYRQLAAIGMSGPPAIFTGDACMNAKAMAASSHAAAIGNLLKSNQTPKKMIEAFDQSTGHLASRLLIALQAGLDSGGEAESVRSAGLVVVHEQPWPTVDLRVDWNEDCPIEELTRLWAVWEPRMAAYMARAMQPATAPTTDTL